MHKWFANSVKYSIIGLFSLILIYLTLLACFSTTAITSTETPLLIADSVWSNLGAVCVFLVFLFLGRKMYRKWKMLPPLSRCSHQTIIRSLLLFTFVVALFFVLCSYKMPTDDPKVVCDVALEWSNGIYSSLSEGEYLHLYPHQAGIIIILYLLGIVFGYNHFIVLQLINVIALFLLIKNTLFIFGLRGRSLCRDVGVSLFCLLFFPCIMYTTFVYGTLIGLSLAIASFRHLLCFEIDHKRKHAVLSVIYIFFSIMVKQNYLVFAIAMVFYVIYKLICKFNIRLLVFGIIITLTMGFVGPFIDFSVYQITNKHLGKGMSSLSWVSMGIRQNSTSYYDGWWDVKFSTIDAFQKCSYDYNCQKEVSKDRILKRINELKNNPGYAIRFFAGKNASQWNNPDFQGWWVNSVMGQDGSSISPTWLGRLMTISVYNRTVFVFLNYFQFIILFGVIIYLLFRSKKDDADILLMITFMGGFLFHLFWEAKGQYTFVYFFLLLPISAEGYTQFLRTTDDFNSFDRRKMMRVGVQASVLAILFLVVGTRSNPLLNNIFIRNEDTQAYSYYLSSNSFSVIPNGEYLIHPLLDSEAILAAKQNYKDENSSVLYFSNFEKHNATKVTIRMKGQYVHICFRKVNMCLDTPQAIGEEGKNIWAYKPNETKAQNWTIKKLKDVDAYYILYDQNLALCYDINSARVYLDQYDGGAKQQWLIKKQNT